MLQKVVLLFLLIGVSVQAYQLKDVREDQNGDIDDDALKAALAKEIFADQNTVIDDGVDDEDDEEDESLDIAKQLVMNGIVDADTYNDDDDDDDDDDGDGDNGDDNLDMVNKLGHELYEDVSPQLMQDDDDMEELDENAIERRNPLWFRFRFPRFRFPRFRFPRFRFPRIRVPRIRLPRIRFPRIRVPRIRLPRIRLPRIRLPRIRFPRIRLPRIRLPRIRFRLKNLIKPEALFKKLLLKLIRKPKPPQNPCPYSESQIMSRINGIRCPAHWKSFFGADARSTANEIVDGENFVNYCKPYTLCKACAPSSPWSSAACENKLNNQLQEFCKAISSDDADLLPWCQGIASKIISYERSQPHSNNADLCKCGAGEAGKP